MNLDDLNDLPEWDDDDEIDRLGEDTEGEEWKPNPTRDACKALYKKWNEIMTMLNGALGTEEEDEEDKTDDKLYAKRHKAMIFGDAFQTAAKIRSSEAGGMYILRMENAAIVRKNAQYIKICMLGFRDEGIIDDTYCKIVRDEIDNFRQLFKDWVATFVKDEYEDEWGLFV